MVSQACMMHFRFHLQHKIFALNFEYKVDIQNDSVKADIPEDMLEIV